MYSISTTGNLVYTDCSVSDVLTDKQMSDVTVERTPRRREGESGGESDDQWRVESSVVSIVGGRIKVSGAVCRPTAHPHLALTHTHPPHPGPLQLTNCTQRSLHKLYIHQLFSG